MIEITILSCIQIAAILYLAKAAIRINRLQTLAKNLDWIIQNQEFAKKNSKPVYFPLVVVGIILYGIIIMGVLMDSMIFLLKYKYIGILITGSTLYIAYYLIDKQLSAKIPLRKERTTSLIRRTLETYAHPSLILSTKIGILCVVLATFTSFLIHKITLATLLCDILIAGLGYCGIWVGIHLGLKEKIPHENDIAQVTKISVGENYRYFSMNLLVGILILIAV